ncbi:MAG: 30S ribosomal protein S4 [Nitrospinae bacterium]|nr:30S ribosomal protein S4 [Nitrospinota bacterium]
MARYRGSVCRLCRREGTKLFLKGARCASAKCSFEKRPWAPGTAGKGRFKISDYGVQLREKQKVKRIYGVLEKHFRNYFKKADNQKGVTGTNLLRMLELRLDNVVYRLGLASSRDQARQFVLHGNVLVNKVRTNIPSFKVSDGDEIEVVKDTIKSEFFTNRVKDLTDKTIVPWLTYDNKKNQGKVVRLPERDDITDINIEERLIIELYSK